MINVDEIFVAVKESASKDKAGYIGSTEFSRMSKVAETMLWLFSVAQYESQAILPERMRPFIAETVLALNDRGQFTIPADHGHRLNFWYNKVVNSGDCEDGPEITKIGLKYLEKSEVWGTMNTSVRAPSVAKKLLYWTYVTDNKAQVYPVNIKPSVLMEYLGYPVWAVRGFTLDTGNDQENYDPTTSTDYEWLESDRSNLIDLILLQVGIRIRETEITQFAAQHRALSQNVPLI